MPSIPDLLGIPECSPSSPPDLETSFASSAPSCCGVLMRLVAPPAPSVHPPTEWLRPRKYCRFFNSTYPLTQSSFPIFPFFAMYLSSLFTPPPVPHFRTVHAFTLMNLKAPPSLPSGVWHLRWSFPVLLPCPILTLAIHFSYVETIFSSSAP